MLRSRVKKQVIQASLAVCLLLACSIITVGLGHGGFYIGQAVFFSQIASVVAGLIVVSLLVVAITVGPKMFAILATLLVAGIFALLFLIWNVEGFFWFSFFTSVPFLLVWLIIVVRALFTRTPAVSSTAVYCN